MTDGRASVNDARARAMWRTVRRLDAYTPAAKHLTTRTNAGAYISLVGVALMVLLGASELIDFLTPTHAKTMSVDATVSTEGMMVDLDVTFPRAPCQVLYVDAYDASGKHEVDVRGRLIKTRLDAAGRSKGDYESAGGVDLGGLVLFQRRPDHGNELKHAKMDMEGCRIHGKVRVQRVAGSLRISTGPESYGMLREVFKDPWEVDVRHRVDQFAFGESFPGSVNPLNGVRRREEKSGVYKYFMKVVPTTYSTSRVLLGLLPWTSVLRTNQYSVTEHYVPSESWVQMPQVFFIYDLSAITVNIVVQAKSWLYFLTKTLATLGGVFALTQMVDRYFAVVLRMQQEGAKKRASAPY